MKLAVLQVADTAPLESLVLMLNHVGYECRICSDSLQGELRKVGCDTVVSLRGLVDSWGYEYPTLKIGEASVKDMDRCDLYVDVKAHRNGPKVWKRWPHLRNKILYYRINGSKPEHVIRTRNGVTEDCGNEIDPGCPVLTPNQWYKGLYICKWCSKVGDVRPETISENPLCHCGGEWSWSLSNHKSYACWPPFHGIERYETPRQTLLTSPVCLIHNLNGWGYAALSDGMRKLGVKLYGRGTADGLVPHQQIPKMLNSALAMVHLKSSDAPGYAIYEALASACPLICTRRLIWRCQMQELLIPGQTCLVFDRETHDPLSDTDVAECLGEVEGHLLSLRNLDRNREIGENGRNRLKEVMWRADRDGDSLRRFMERHYGSHY